MVQRSRGFTLLELMIVVAIIGVISAIAFPSYRENVLKTRRADARGAVMGLANALERFRANSGTYVGAAVPAIFSDKSPIDGADRYYTLSLSGLGGNTYTITATPHGSQASDKCGSLILDQSGTRTVAGASGGMTNVSCWR
ncbi:MAG: type IV pilin protein [Oceanococcus sp.]